MTSVPTHRDRGVRLRLFGVLTMVSGIASLGLGFFHLALPSLSRDLIELDVSTAQVVTGLFTFSMIGVALLCCGVGSIRQRRWVRPAMLTVGWTWLFVGLVSVGFMVSNLDDMVILAGAGRASQPPEVERLVRWLLLLPTLLFGLAVPLALLWAYNPADVLHTCRARNPQPDWSDRCPSTVLILALALGFTGFLSLPMALRPVLPWFGGLLTGNVGSVVTLAAGGTFIWMGWALFRLRRTGWWASGLVSLVFAISTVWTLLRTPRIEWYRALDYPEKHIEQLLAGGEPAVWPGVAATVALTVATAVYLASIRKHFR